MQRNLTLWLVALAAVSSFFSHGSWAGSQVEKGLSSSSVTRYAISEIGTLGGDESSAVAVNNRGEVVGTAKLKGDEVSHAFVFSNGKLVDLGSLGGESEARAINNTGVIVGVSTAKGSDASRSFIYSQGKLSDLNVGGRETISHAVSINDSGQIVGTYYPPGGRTRAYLLDGGKFVQLGTLGGDDCVPIDINNRGEILGSATTDMGEDHTCIWLNGEVADIERKLRTTASTVVLPKAINDKGAIVGYSATEDGKKTYAFIFDGAKRALGDLGRGGSVALGLNNNGDAVGYAKGKDGLHAVLFTQGKAIDLNTKIEQASGWHLREAHAINDRGEIIGSGELQGKGQRGFLLRPVELR